MNNEFPTFPGPQGPVGPAGPAGPTPTGSGNKVLATPADGSSGPAALRRQVVADIPTGTSSSTVAIGNDARFNPTPSTAGKIPYDTGSGYSATATGGTSSQLLHGGSTPAYGPVSLTVDVSGVLPIANGGTNSSATLSNKQLIVSSGGALVELGAATNGQLAIGNTGNLPTLAVPTGSNGITLSTGAGSLSISQTFGTDSSHAAAGNDSRFNPTPSTAGKIPFDTGSGYSATATGGTSSQLLHGGSTPAYGAVSLTAEVSGVLPIANGGTNSSTSLSNKQLIVSSGGALVELGAATNGQLAIGNTGNLPTLAVPTSSNGITLSTGAGSLSISQTFGTDSSHAAAGNDSRFNPTPSTAGKIPYDTGSGYSATATGGTSSQLLHGGSTPAYGAVSLTAEVSGVLPIANGGTNSSTSLSNKRLIVSSGGALVELGAATNGQIPIGSTGNLPVLALPTGSNGVTVTAGAGTLAIGFSPATGSAEGSYTITATIGTYADTSITVTLPAAGTYRVWADVRTLVKANAVGTFGNYIVLKLRDNTNSTDLSLSERIGAFTLQNTANVYENSHIEVASYTVSGAAVIDIYAMRQTTGPGSFTTAQLVSDTEGRTVLGFQQLS